LSGIVDLIAMACLIPASWNHVAGWLKEIEALQQAA
jgi:hypothetical protein